MNIKDVIQAWVDCPDLENYSKEFIIDGFEDKKVEIFNGKIIVDDECMLEAVINSDYNNVIIVYNGAILREFMQNSIADMFGVKTTINPSNWDLVHVDLINAESKWHFIYSLLNIYDPFEEIKDFSYLKDNKEFCDLTQSLWEISEIIINHYRTDILTNTVEIPYHIVYDMNNFSKI